VIKSPIKVFGINLASKCFGLSNNCIILHIMEKIVLSDLDLFGIN
jgi:hypothetical protein